MRRLCKRFRHLWWAPWQETKRCLICGSFQNLTVGENSITSSPAGVGDVIRWSANKAAMAAGDLGMNVTSGRGQLFVSGTSKDIAVVNDIAGGPGVQLITPTAITPFATITLALAAAVSGDIVQVGPGTYAESVTVPAGVTLRGSGATKTIISGAGATGDRIALGDRSIVQDLAVILPTNATRGIIGPPGGGSVFAICINIMLRGNGASGVGIWGQAGSMFLNNCYYDGGVCDKVFDATNCVLTCVLTYILSGTVTTGWSVGPGSTVVAETMGIQLGSVVTDAVLLSNGTLYAGRVVLLSCVNAIRVINNDAVVNVNSGRLVSSGFDVLVDVTVVSGSLVISGIEMSKNKVSMPGGYWTSANIVMSFDDSSAGELGLYSWGKFVVGVPERPRSSSLGQGAATTRGMKVLTTDSTAGAASDGGNFIDVTSAAADPGGGTFSFQGTAVNHTILFGTTLQNASGLIKYWAHKYNITTASSTDGVYVFELWNGAAWVEVKMLVDAEVEVYRYANKPFIRANVEEYVELRLSNAVTWSSKTINGTAAYWIRVRISTQPTTAPVFDRWRLSPAHADINERGNFIVHGLARWKETVFSGGNVYGETGSVGDISVAVGSGGVPTGWNQNIKNSNLNTPGDAVTFQFTLPRGICTACPLMFRVYYQVTPGTAIPTVTFSCLPIQASGVNVASPIGGVVPTPRTDANTETLTAKVAQVVGPTAVPVTTANKIHAMDFSPFNIDSYYEGDMVAIRFQLTDDGTPDQDIYVWAIEVIGVKFTLGEPL